MNNDNANYPNIHAEIGTMFHLDIDGTPAIIVPADCDLKTFPELRAVPVRIEKDLIVQSVHSFCDYFTRFFTEKSVIFVDVDKLKICGVLDYHESREHTESALPDFCKHRVMFECPLTPEAKNWFDHDKKRMTQFDFASFIESGQLEITSPTGAEMLEIASTLHAKNAVNFRSGIRLDNGQTQFTYNEQIEGSAGTQGQLTIPTEITLALRMFRGDAEAWPLKANFRYRVTEGKLQMWYELVRPHIIKDLAIAEVIKQIKANYPSTLLVESVL